MLRRTSFTIGGCGSLTQPCCGRELILPVRLTCPLYFFDPIPNKNGMYFQYSMRICAYQTRRGEVLRLGDWVLRYDLRSTQDIFIIGQRGKVDYTSLFKSTFIPAALISRASLNCQEPSRSIRIQSTPEKSDGISTSPSVWAGHKPVPAPAYQS